jgi:hypothetical protein
VLVLVWTLSLVQLPLAVSHSYVNRENGNWCRLLEGIVKHRIGDAFSLPSRRPHEAEAEARRGKRPNKAPMGVS